VKCLGCGRDIPWDGVEMFCYTCPCGALVFYQGENVFPPASLVLKLGKGEELSHIDYYLGKSSYTSPEKEVFYNSLRERGAIWSWECPECRDRFLQRAKMEIENGLYLLPLHPELAKLIENTPVPEGYEKPKGVC